MTNLRLLKIREVQLPEGLEYLSSELRLLDWDGYPLKSLPSNLQLNKLVELKMDGSRIGQLWKGNKPFNMLKSISFADCKSLVKTPDFTEIPNLKDLILRGCSRLCEIHPSLLVHKKIKWMDLEDCSSLKTLPRKIHMESLRSLELSGCSKLKRFPEIIGSMECLLELYLNETAIKELPLSVELLSGLESLKLEGCKNLSSLPSTINGLKALQTLSLSHCSRLVSLPSTIDGLKSLETLNLIKCTKLMSLPSSINGLESLITLCLSGCSKLESMPDTLGQVESLRFLSLRKTAIRQQVSSFFSMKNLSELDFCGCKGSPSKSLFKKSSNPMTLILPSLPSNLCYFTKLDLSDCNLGEGAITGDLLGSFISLVDLDLSQNNFVSLPASINRLSNLRVLKLNYCRRLQILPELPSKIYRLEVNCCISLERLSNALRLCNSNLSDISSQCCLKLNGSGEAFSIMKEHLKVVTNQSNRFSMVVPGSEVPEWFQHKSDGDSIKIEKPPDLYNNNSKLVGFVVCSRFLVHKISPAHTMRSLFGVNWAICDVTDNLSDNDPINDMFNWSLDLMTYEVGLRLPELDHLWLLYLPDESIKQLNSPEFSIGSLGDTEEIFEVKRLGVHPVYENEDFVEFH